MTKKVFEGKYELDSLAAVLKLSFEYYNITRDISCFTSNWKSAMDKIMDTIEYQQKSTVDEVENPQYR